VAAAAALAAAAAAAVVETGRMGVADGTTNRVSAAVFHGAVWLMGVLLLRPWGRSLLPLLGLPTPPPLTPRLSTAKEGVLSSGAQANTGKSPAGTGVLSAADGIEAGAESTLGGGEADDATPPPAPAAPAEPGEGVAGLFLLLDLPCSRSLRSCCKAAEKSGNVSTSMLRVEGVKHPTLERHDDYDGFAARRVC
jgi:hypothetical protein